MTANRVAALSAVLSALGAFVAAMVGVFPHSWENALLAVSALLTHLATALYFMRGSQQHDRLQQGGRE